MFLLKKIVAPLLLPFPICLGLLLGGLFLLWFTRRQRAGKIVVTISTALLLLIGYGFPWNSMLKALEYQYPPLAAASDAAAQEESGAPIKWIVVLGGGHASDPLLPITSQLSPSSLVRLVEAIRLHRGAPGSKLILSEGRIFDPVSGAEVMARVAEDLGVDPQNIILEAHSRDTEDEARLIQPIVGNDKFILVTSASHMPRSMALFTKLGMNPVAGPTDYWARERRRITPGMFYPGSGGLRNAERALHEYLGLAWSKLRGRS